MTVISSLQSLASNVGVTARETAQSGLRPYSAVDTEARVDLLRARGRLLRLFRALEGLARAAGVETRTLLDINDAQSQSSIGLDLTRTAATLNSNDEINASPMSFTPFGPNWSDGSSALITIGGEYDGSHGSGNLTFEVRRAGTRGVNDLRIRVEDPLGNRIRNVNVRTSHDLDRQYDLRNGLYLTLGSGALINRDTTTIQVSTTVGAAVDPTRPLGGTRNQNPNLQFGAPTIADGSFQLNGTGISVATSDSINDVITRINQSGAGVTATFNALSERIEFVNNTVGSAGTIDLQGDTSNFLQAVKLDSANTVAGRDADNESVLAGVAAFAGVQSGEFVINDERIAVDSSNDSLDSVIDRINASGAGVTATFDPASLSVRIQAEEGAGRLEIDGNGTGLFAALNIAEGRYEHTARGRGIGRRQAYAIADELGGVLGELNHLFRDASFEQRGRNAGAFRGPLESAIRTAFGDSLENGIDGLRIDPSADARRRGGYADMDRNELTLHLQKAADPLMNLLRGLSGNRGLVELLMNGTQQAVRNVNAQLGIRGGIVSTFA
ncbi:MAG: flagellin hook IN motif-containing protein [Woeseiaceae bacterium]|nr:flagellin hook IN motif-containing protein [Woeseiaceae bacterium]